MIKFGTIDRTLGEINVSIENELNDDAKQEWILTRVVHPVVYNWNRAVLKCSPPLSRRVVSGK